MLEDIIKEELKKETVDAADAGAQKEKVEEYKPKIENPNDLTVLLMDSLLKEKNKMVSYAEIASILTNSFFSFENESKKAESLFNEDKLKDKSASFVFNMTIFGLYTKALGDLLINCNPEEAVKITALIPKPKKK